MYLWNTEKLEKMTVKDLKEFENYYTQIGFAE